MMHGRAAAFLLAAALLAPRYARAADPRPAATAIDACAEASEDAQRERARGRLRAARARTVQCLDARCPALIRRDCDLLAAEIARLLPTVVFRVRGPDGADLPGATVQIDDDPAASPVDGRSHEVDPGPHELTAHAPGFAPARVKIVVEEGVRARVIELRPVPQVAPTSTREPSGSAAEGSSPSRGTWIAGGALAGLGVVGLGLFAGLGLSADSDYRHLRDTCGGSCSSDDASSVRRRFQVADVALTVGVVALASAVVVILLGPRHPVADTAR